MKFRKFEVGKLFEEGITRYNEEAKFEFTQSGPALLIFFKTPTEKEIESIRADNIKIGFTEISEIIFMLYKFEGIPWIDAPYSIHLSGNIEPQKVEEGTGYGLQIFLIDADTGILKVMRLIGMGTEWSRRFREAILRQKNIPFDHEIYNLKIENIYKELSPKDIADTVPFKNCYRVKRK